MQRPVDRHLERVIRRTILDAKRSGKDYSAQNKIAAHTVRRIRPDMTAPEAVALVNLVRQDEIETKYSEAPNLEKGRIARIAKKEAWVAWIIVAIGAVIAISSTLSSP